MVFQEVPAGVWCIMRAIQVRKKASEGLDRSLSGDLWRNTLSSIRSVFGKLIYLAGLRNPNSGRYEHHGLALVFGADEAHNGLRRSHTEIFSKWQQLDLEAQYADLTTYLSGLEEERSTVIETWMQVKHYQTLVPSSIRGLERRLYLANLVALIQLMRNADTLSGKNPAA
jgi:hypothetical protein